MVEDLRKVPSRHGLLRETRRTTADGREPGVFSLQLCRRGPFPGFWNAHHYSGLPVSPSIQRGACPKFYDCDPLMEKNTISTLPKY